MHGWGHAARGRRGGAGPQAMSLLLHASSSGLLGRRCVLTTCRILIGMEPSVASQCADGRLRRRPVEISGATTLPALFMECPKARRSGKHIDKWQNSGPTRPVPVAAGQGKAAVYSKSSGILRQVSRARQQQVLSADSAPLFCRRRHQGLVARAARTPGAAGPPPCPFSPRLPQALPP